LEHSLFVLAVLDHEARVGVTGVRISSSATMRACMRVDASQNHRRVLFSFCFFFGTAGFDTNSDNHINGGDAVISPVPPCAPLHACGCELRITENGSINDNVNEVTAVVSLVPQGMPPTCVQGQVLVHTRA
jgi:hypothetical protein